MSCQVGDRVMAISHSNKTKVYIFGYGTYEGNQIPKDYPPDQQPVGTLGQHIIQEGLTNPCIKLDDGNYIWGCECWWDEIEKCKENIEGLEIEELDIKETRKEWLKETN